MDTQPLKALDIEALTYIYPSDTSSAVSERDRWWRESFRGHAWVVAITVVFALLGALTWALVPVAGQ
jgi:hypothetical protein